MTFLFLTLIVLICIYYVYLVYFIIEDKKRERGYMIINDVLLKEDVNYINVCWDNLDYNKIIDFLLKNDNIHDMIKRYLGKDYILINYSYLIENSSIHTYHRDYTSSRNYNNLQNPSYTMILYLDDSNTGLNLIPGSHLEKTRLMYMKNKSIKPNVNPGTVIIFDADILHSGTKTDKKRRCIQFKIIHKQDIDKLPSLHDYYVLINKPNIKHDVLASFETFCTRHFPFLMDISNENIKTSFVEERTGVQKIISSIIFSDKDFYKPIRIKRS
jgi:hypothetical protein